MPRTRPELALNWSRTELQLVVRLHGATPADGRVVLSVLDSFFLDQLEARGYDPRTLRFSIRKRGAGTLPATEHDAEDIA